ncbi:NAD-dependent epimerase/dehydratase family protein [Gammaproteobacteria bacterium]|nr:NAD-dependent epimerase/dehydratase family protein [Gammaproteobacteria bacterium]
MFNLSNKDLDELSKDFSLHKNTFDNKSFLITGGTGFIGKWLICALNELVKKNNFKISITVLTRNKNLFINDFKNDQNINNINFIESDIRYLNEIKPEKYEFDYLVLGANDATYEFTLNTSLLTDTLIYGTNILIDKFVSKKTKMILHLSSGAVYGDISNLKSGVSESSNANFDISDVGSMYGLAKILVESTLNNFGYKNNINITNARCFAFSGPHLPLDKHFAFGNFIRNALMNEDIIINGDGSPVRSYLYPVDLSNFLLRLFTINKPNITVNVGSSHQISIKDLAEKILDVTNLNKKVIIRNSDVEHPEKSNFYLPNTSYAKSLGLKENISIDESILRTFNFYQN